MASDGRDQNRWVVDLGGGDTFEIERTPAGLVAMSIPTRREIFGDREAVAEIRAALAKAAGLDGDA